MHNSFRKMGRKQRLLENLLLIRADLKCYKSVSIPEEHQLFWGGHQIIRMIRLNVNNLTRTKAYLDFYIFRPEIHWSFLAHMVSRNGGWNKTDLKGEFLSKHRSALLYTATNYKKFANLKGAKYETVNERQKNVLRRMSITSNTSTTSTIRL